LKKNLQDKWWKDFVERRAECMGLETATILNPKGAVNFVTPLAVLSSWLCVVLNSMGGFWSRV
jgi:hypothetical protein